MRLPISFLASVLLLGAALAQAPNEQTTSDQQAGLPAYQAPTTSQKQDIHQNLKDIHFAFNRYDLTSDDQQSLQQTASWLKANPKVLVTIAGDADERGGIVYNVYLSDQRAKATRDALVSMGVPESQIVFATGWGKLYPICMQSDESCWAQNRRAHFEPWQAEALSAYQLVPGSESDSLLHADLSPKPTTLDLQK